MRLLTCLAFVGLLVTNSAQIESLEDLLVYSVEPDKNIRKRDVNDTSDSGSAHFRDFVEEKLIQESQALEHLIKLVQENGRTTRQLLESVSNHVVEPIMPEKVEVYYLRGLNKSEDDEADNAVVRMGKNVSKFGKLVGNILLNELVNKTSTDPVSTTNLSSE